MEIKIKIYADICICSREKSPVGFPIGFSKIPWIGLDRVSDFGVLRNCPCFEFSVSDLG